MWRYDELGTISISSIPSYQPKLWSLCLLTWTQCNLRQNVKNVNWPASDAAQSSTDTNFHIHVIAFRFRFRLTTEMAKYSFSICLPLLAALTTFSRFHSSRHVLSPCFRTSFWLQLNVMEMETKVSDISQKTWWTAIDSRSGMYVALAYVFIRKYYIYTRRFQTDRSLLYCEWKKLMGSSRS